MSGRRKTPMIWGPGKQTPFLDLADISIHKCTIPLLNIYIVKNSIKEYLKIIVLFLFMCVWAPGPMKAFYKRGHAVNLWAISPTSIK